jgi:hypothetical protein
VCCEEQLPICIIENVVWVFLPPPPPKNFTEVCSDKNVCDVWGRMSFFSLFQHDTKSDFDCYDLLAAGKFLPEI